jgi:hypothetical protein
MKQLVAVLASLSFAGAAHAGLPSFNANCPGGIELHADEGGPVYFNGNAGSLKKVNDTYFEATGAGITAEIMISPDGSTSVTYTGKGGANGVCTLVKYDIAAANPPAQPAKPARPAAMPPGLVATCRGAAAGQYGTKPMYINVGKPSRARTGWAIKGTADQGNQGKKPFQCNFDNAGKLKDVMSLVNEGAL